MNQIWNNYTTEDHEVWNLLFERQVKNLHDKAWSTYLKCIPEVGIGNSHVPDFSIIEKAS